VHRDDGDGVAVRHLADALELRPQDEPGRFARPLGDGGRAEQARKASAITLTALNPVSDAQPCMLRSRLGGTRNSEVG
jgi:hypothetical protein